jgi:SAM-dependent methyltransferase
MTTELDYRAVNRAVWSYLADGARSASSRPYGPAEAAEARAWLDPWGWLPWDEIGQVLCLGSGGGQQAPMFASLGCEVTVVDLCPEQLELDRQAAAALGTTLECVEGDMQDLSVLGDRAFDLVHQPVSTCYVPDVAAVYRQVRRVLRPSGRYDVEHWNPIHTQLDGYGRWDGGGYPLAHPQVPGVPVPWYPDGAENAPVCWHFVHRLGDLVGGLCRAGFRVLRVAERSKGDPEAEAGSEEHLAAHAPSFLRLLARADEGVSP